MNTSNKIGEDVLEYTSAQLDAGAALSTMALLIHIADLDCDTIGYSNPYKSIRGRKRGEKNERNNDKK